MDTRQPSEHWLQIILSTSPVNAESFADQLSAAGAVAVTFQDSADEPIYETLPGEERLWSDTRVIGLFAAETPVDDIIQRLQSNLQLVKPPPFLVQRLENRDWERSWLERFKPMSFGHRLWVCPTHCTPPDPDAVNILLDPGLAFGTGTHPTTALCLEWLDRQPLAGLHVIDYGCGSGILAIAAARLGATRVWATDLDPQALSACRDNARSNNVAEIIQTFLPTELPGESCDVLLANILARPLIELAAHFKNRIKPGGHLILSGILAEQYTAVSTAYQPWFSCQTPLERENWLLIHCIKNN